MQSPPPVNLPFLPDLIEEISKIPGPTSCIVADYRHWFHQIKLNDEVSKYFCVGRSNEWFRWSTLPMGISWAPFIAQCISWSLLLHTPRDAEWLFEFDRQLEIHQPPSFVRLRDGGFITVFYDNVIAIGSPKTIKKLDIRWFGESTTADAKTKKTGTFKRFGACVKEKSFCSGTNYSFTYLGVLFEISSKRLHCGNHGGWKNHLRWRQSPEKLEKWINSFENTWRDGRLSRRQTAKLCGRCLWRLGLTRVPLCEASDLIKVVKRIAIGRNWDEPAHLTSEDKAALSKHYDIVKANSWMSFDEEPDKRTKMTACSDSSDTGYGYIIFHEPENIERGFEWNAKDRSRHIFTKELNAAITTIRRCIDINNNGPTEVIIGIDNSAAAHALRNMHSSNADAEKELASLWHKLSETKSIVKIVSLLSAENASDAASRGRRASEESAKKCAQLLAQTQMTNALNGFRLNEYNPLAQPRFTGEIRHEEKSDLDGATEDLISFCLAT
jgi:hypothetical protein